MNKISTPKKSRSDYITKFIKENYKRCEIKINKQTEKDLIDWLSNQPNVNDYIKSLILKDMKNN